MVLYPYNKISMNIRILIFLAIVFLAIKYVKKQKGMKPMSKKKRLHSSDLARLRRQFRKNAQYYDPIEERQKLALSLQLLMNGKASAGNIEHYDHAVQAVKTIVKDREVDVLHIRSVDQMKQDYNKNKDIYSDKLQELIDINFSRSDEILAKEHFAVDIDELKIILRYLSWLVQMGKEGRDNSVHWDIECKTKLDTIRNEVANERAIWKDLENL